MATQRSGTQRSGTYCSLSHTCRHSHSQIGQVVGGTKGNAVLDYISGAPNKASVIEAAPNALDYDQLTKYGYSHLVTPIMKAGGRLAMYDLLQMEKPDTSQSLKPLVVTAPKLEIDREGKNEKERYSGLKLGQIIDDDLQAQVLQSAQERAARGEELRPKLQEESYEQPFADKRYVGKWMHLSVVLAISYLTPLCSSTRNVSKSPQTPDWTPGT